MSMLLDTVRQSLLANAQRTALDPSTIKATFPRVSPQHTLCLPASNIQHMSFAGEQVADAHDWRRKLRKQLLLHRPPHRGRGAQDSCILRRHQPFCFCVRHMPPASHMHPCTVNTNRHLEPKGLNIVDVSSYTCRWE